MKVFLDTNILIDVLAEREPFYSESARVWTLAEKGLVNAHISAISVNNIFFYVVRRLRSAKVAYRMMVLLRNSFACVGLDPQILNQAIDADLRDFEDAIQYFSALHAGVDCIVSRNVRDFPKSDLSILTPHEFLAAHGQWCNCL